MPTITALKLQARNKSRVNVFIDGAYLFAVDVTQVVELGLRTGAVYTEEDLCRLEEEGQFGKLYTRALEYVLTRPRSQRELTDYLYRKTKDTRTSNGTVKKGYTKELTRRVFERLQAKGYIDDERFARFWVENRQVSKGISARKLRSELAAKGVAGSIVESVFSSSERDESNDIRRVLYKKAHKYPDRQKLIAYLLRQGFAYDTVQEALSEYEDTN